MSRCDFGGMIILPAKITSSQFEWMLTICQLDSLAREYTYVHRIVHHEVYRLRYTPGYFLAGQKNTDGGNVFQFMKSEESMAGKDYEPEETCSKLAGTHVTIGKIKFR
jgi:hypothetical protein